MASEGIIDVEKKTADLKQTCWSDLPPEILRDVLARIEKQTTWPHRKSVVACAGVCKDWRNTIREILEPPVVCQMLTFPISLKQPGPRSLHPCIIRRDRKAQTYHLYLGAPDVTYTGKFLLAARKFTHFRHSEFIISTDAKNFSKRSNTYVGRMSTEHGERYIIYDGMPPDAGTAAATNGFCMRCSKQVSSETSAGNYPVARILYKREYCTRSIRCVMTFIPSSALEPGGVAPTPTVFSRTRAKASPSPKCRCGKRVSRGSSPERARRPLELIKVRPDWNNQLQSWCMNFGGRVTVASVKNFQLAALLQRLPDKASRAVVTLRFGKVGRDSFVMDYGYPLSAFQAFAICLSSFDARTFNKPLWL